MKKYVNGFLIVEGYADKAFLSSFLDCEVIVLEGFCIPRRTIMYAKALGERLTPLLLTDPDEAGETIRKRVNNEIDNCVNLNIAFVNRKHYKKHGVAECDKEEILKILSPHLSDKPVNKGDLSFKDLCLLLDKYGDVKNKISTAFNLGSTNNKVMINRLNYLNIKINEIIRVIENGN